MIVSSYHHLLNHSFKVEHEITDGTMMNIFMHTYAHELINIYLEDILN